MHGRRWMAVGLMLVLGAVPALLWGGAENYDTFTLFGGSNVDSTEHPSPWIPVRGANRVIIKTWSTKSAFGNGTEADSLFADSIATWKTLWSDSVLFMARDSAGTIVSGVSLRGRSTDANKLIFPMCADSVMFTGAYQDSGGFTQTGLDQAPVNTPLRAPANGSGVLTWVFVLAPNGVATYGDGSFTKQYMRVRITPLRRMTANTSGEATGGTRVNGLKGLRMVAYVYYKNR